MRPRSIRSAIDWTRTAIPAPWASDTISVVMTVYNHEKYVAAAIESVLGQTVRDFQFIIVNDGSTDGTDAVIRAYRDSRITSICQEHQGESAAINNGIARATGRYIALMDGDDVCHSERLARQRDFLVAQRARAVASWIALIDDDGAPLDDHLDLLGVANAPPCRSRAESVRRLWFKNYLWPSSAMLERGLLREVGGMCLSSMQVQDYLLWIEVIKRAQIHTIPEPLVQYRVRHGRANVSLNPDNTPRIAFEMKQLYRRLLDGLAPELFREAFAPEIRNPDFAGEREYAIERALLYLTHPIVTAREVGVERLFGLMQEPEAVRLLATRYDFTLPDFYRLENDPTYRSLPWNCP
jgi:hypothetical protein